MTHQLVFRDGFANPDGTANSDMPINEARVTLAEIREGGTRMTIQSIFPDDAAMLLGRTTDEAWWPSGRRSRAAGRTG